MRDAIDTAGQVQGLRDAAAIVTGCGEMDSDLHDADGVWIGKLSKALAVPVATELRAAAELIEGTGSALGLMVSYQLEIGGLVLGRDLGHNR